MRNFCCSRLLENRLRAFVRRHLPYVNDSDCGFCANALVSAESLHHATQAAFERPGQKAQYQTRKTSELKQNARNEEVE
jgi:hypothetical protein